MKGTIRCQKKNPNMERIVEEGRPERSLPKP
jgi:hypothetical protein